MQASLISVIMPCYNAAFYIKEAIGSVLSQTHTNLELIIINDGSTDETEAIIKLFNDPRIKYYKQGNQGQSKASNFGLSVSKGDYIKFFDADDVMNHEHLEKQLQKINGRTNAIASCAWGRFFNDNPVSTVFNAEDVWKDMQPIEWIKAALKQDSDMMPAWLWLIPKKIIIKAGFWNERLSLNNDFEFSTRLLLNAEDIVFAPDAKIYYRSANQVSLSSRRSATLFKDAILSNKLGIKNILAVDSSNEMKKLCANRLQLWAFRIYPFYPSLVKELENEIAKLGGSDLKLKGSFLLRLISDFVNWKTARLFQSYYYKLRYS